MAIIITRDGKLAEWAGRRHSTELEALGGLHKLVGYSAQHAIEHEGYAFVDVPDDTWSTLEASALRRQVQSVWHHTHPQYAGHTREERAMVRENCQACCLDGYTSDLERFYPKSPTAPINVSGPNVSNWQRDYVQAGRTIPAAWRNAFYAFESDDNEPWKIALRRDIATFGVRFSDDEPE